MRSLVLIFVSLFVFSAIFANSMSEGDNKEKSRSLKTTSVFGTVSDKTTGESLAGVKIVLNRTQKSVYTDFEGNFELPEVIAGYAKITVSYISYENKVETIHIDPRKLNKINIKIKNISN